MREVVLIKYRSRLFSVKEPYDISSTEELFFRAVRESCEFHYNNCAEYKRALDSSGFSPDMLREYGDIKRLPFLPTALFKRHEIFSMPKNRIAVKVTSSGTKGSFSRIGFDIGSLWCGLKMTLRITRRRRLISPVPVNYIVFGYKPHRSNKTAVAKTAFGATLFAPALRRAYALKYDGERYTPDLEGVIEAIQRYSRSRFPTRFMGFPSYTYFMMKLMEERNISVSLPKNSIIMLGGGWKQFYLEQVDKAEFYRLAKKTLNVEESNIVEFFGAVEHPILYCDCKNHHFHIPAYSRVIIRDVHTLKPLENGRMGLINLITPMVRATPILSVMTDDLGVIRDGAECGCGCASPYLEIIGRVGLKDIKTCAAGAAELLKEALE